MTVCGVRGSTVYAVREILESEKKFRGFQLLDKGVSTML
ncbi:hypothetical protein L917_08389 [Phytophthora nicotianae]|uniref:Uncharacterized protein n=1 Tax=Phytophthora nicotianae TaxID=4792 RepID=W2L7P7_PHYNI|nr:hypothetical protein L915_08560 [Phytophthora nicotianae]ETL93456.1 hypothetical protein L917_08389 [Phytophthora nicotianae]